MHKKMGEKKRQQGQKHFLDISSLMCKAAPLTHPHVRSSRTRPTAASSSSLAPTTADFKEMELAFMMRWSRTGRHLEPQQQESGSRTRRARLHRLSSGGYFGGVVLDPSLVVECSVFWSSWDRSARDRGWKGLRRGQPTLNWIFKRHSKMFIYIYLVVLSITFSFLFFYVSLNCCRKDALPGFLSLGFSWIASSSTTSNPRKPFSLSTFPDEIFQKK